MKNGEGYHDPTAGVAIKNAFKSAKQKQMKIQSMRNAARKECMSYDIGCIKTVNGIKKVCPLKDYKRECLILTGQDEEVENAYKMLFSGGK